MKTKLLNALAAVTLLLMPNLNFAQSAPDLGAASGFALFTAVGAFTAVGDATFVTGDAGTNVGAFSAFPPGVIVGNIHVADPASASAATDVATAYSYLDGITCGMVIGTTMGSGQTLTPNVYCIGAASTINGELILDGGGDPGALFIFEIDGALSTTTLSSVTLIGGASLCNVYWQINGAVSLGEGSLFQGTIVADGAISLLEGATLLGRALSTAGQIDLHNNIVTIGFQPIAATIVASGATTFCEGDSVILSGNIDGTWSTSETSTSITVKTSGDYFVVNTTGCGSDTSNHIIVTANSCPICTPPANITITEIGNDQIQVCWDAQDDAIGYTLQYHWIGHIDLNTADITAPDTCTAIDLLGHTSVIIHVATVCSDNSVTAYSTDTIYQYAGPCTVPTNLTATNIHATTVKLNWTPGTVTSTQRIRYQELNATTSFKVWVRPTAISKKLTGLTPSTTYQWKVRGDCWSTDAQFTTLSAKLDESLPSEASINELSAYPNPASDNLTVDIQMNDQEDQLVTIQIVSMIGQVIFSKEIMVTDGHSINSIDLGNQFSDGFYILRVIAGEQNMYERIAISNSK